MVPKWARSRSVTAEMARILFFFKQKTANEMPKGLEVRRVLFRSPKEGGQVHLRKYRALSLRNILVLCQMAASLTLLLLTGYLGLGIQSTVGVQEGFNPNNLYLIALDPVRDGYSGARAAAFFDKLLKRVKTLPGVTSAC